jgi:hypothetical protein
MPINLFDALFYGNQLDIVTTPAGQIGHAQHEIHQPTFTIFPRSESRPYHVCRDRDGLETAAAYNI